MGAEDIMESVRYFNGRPVYIGRDGEAMTLREWATAYQNFAGRTLARTRVGDNEVISTWRGIDIDPLTEGPPLIYGTIIRRKGDVWTDEIESATEEDAMCAHWDLVDRVKTEMSE